MDDIERRLVAAAERRIAGEVSQAPPKRGVTITCTIIVVASLALHAVSLAACIHYARQARLYRDAVKQLIAEKYPEAAN